MALLNTCHVNLALALLADHSAKGSTVRACRFANLVCCGGRLFRRTCRDVAGAWRKSWPCAFGERPLSSHPSGREGSFGLMDAPNWQLDYPDPVGNSHSRSRMSSLLERRLWVPDSSDRPEPGTAQAYADQPGGRCIEAGTTRYRRQSRQLQVPIATLRSCICGRGRESNRPPD